MTTPFQLDIHTTLLPDLSALRGNNILITGSTGLIGGCLVEMLARYAIQYDFKVYAGCRNLEAGAEKFGHLENVECICVDVTKPIDCTDDFHYIIDAASNASPRYFASDPVGVVKSNILGVSNLIEYGIRHKLKKFVYLSSGEVYGEGCMQKWAEPDSGYIDSMSVRACYPSSKRAAETLCVAYAKQYGVDVVVARLCHTYGPGFKSDDNRVYAQFIKNVINGENIILKSPGSQYRSWIYVVDCATAIIYCMLYGKNCEAYNVADEMSNITIRELAEHIAAREGREVVFDLSETTPNQTPISKAVFDTSKIKSLGWLPRFNITIGIEHTIDSVK